MSKGKKISVGSVIETVFIIVCAICIAAMLVLYFSFKKDNAMPTVGGYSFYYLKANNMEPTIPSGTAIIAQKSKVDDVAAGDTVLANIGEDLVFIGVTNIEEESGMKYYTLKFNTAVESQTFRVPQTDIIAKAMWKSSILGTLLGFATSTFGIMLVIIIPSFVIIVFQIIRIINVKRLEEEASSLDDIDEIFEAREEEKEPPIRISQPKYSEENEARLSVGSDGKAEYEKPEPPKKSVYESAGIAEYKAENSVRERRAERERTENPLFDPLYGENVRRNVISSDDEFAKKPVTASARTSGGLSEFDDSLMRRPTKIEPVAPKSADNAVNDAFELAAAKARKSVLESREMAEFAEAPIRTEAAPAKAEPSASAFDESVKTFFGRTEPEKPAEAAKTEESTSVPTIPADAVVPKEKLAPPAKKSNNKKVEDLMKFIDKAESDLKRK